MKFCWRITKYTPKYRNSSGVFLNNEWTSYSDIGKTFNSIPLTYEEYERIETLYIKAIEYFMNCHAIKSFQIIALEKPKKINSDIHNTSAMTDLFNNIKDNDSLPKSNLENFCKLILRDKLWCKLIYDEKMFVHFGYDYYMYIGSSLPCKNVISAIQKDGLFVEPFESPYE